MPGFRLDPTHFDLLRVTGADAERFLQGQLTCDVSTLATGSFTYGAACNNKGRIIAPFVLYRLQQDFLLVFRKGLAALFLAALRKFLPFYKCSMALEESLTCLGLAGASMPGWLATQGWSAPAPGQADALPAGWIVRMTGEHPQYIVCSTATSLDALAGAMTDPMASDDGSRWQATSLRNGHFPFATTDSELYTPQELNYEQQQYISFTKGCYTGQEIVARMHYRGKIKRQLYRIEFPCGHETDPTTLALLKEDGSTLAECQKATRLPCGICVALVMLPVEIAEQDLEFQTSAGPRVRLQQF